VALYNPPGTGTVSYPYYYQQYEARIQPRLGAAGQVVISYNVNTFAVDTGCVSANAHDARIYRPRFIDVPSSKFNPAAAIATPGTASVAAAPATSGSNLSGQGIRHSGPPFPTDNPPPVPPAPPASPMAARAPAATTLAATGIDGSTDWYQMPLGGRCRDIPAPSSAPAVTVDEHGIVAARWQNVGTDVWYYPWMCDATQHSCGSAGTSFPWFPAWPAPGGNLWTTVPEGYLDPIGRTTSPQVDTNGHRFAIYVRSFGAGYANAGGNSPQTILTVSR
jgi:hypothetical protein